jgi:hypothetical protein
VTAPIGTNVAPDTDHKFVEHVSHQFIQMTVTDHPQTANQENHERSPPTPAKDVGQLRPLAERPNPPDKPLPSLPVATVQTSSPIVRRSLIDAKEKPLRRSISPCPAADRGEEWPALSPSRPTTPNAPQDMARKDSFQLAKELKDKKTRSCLTPTPDHPLSDNDDRNPAEIQAAAKVGGVHELPDDTTQQKYPPDALAEESKFGETPAAPADNEETHELTQSSGAVKPLKDGCLHDHADKSSMPTSQKGISTSSAFPTLSQPNGAAVKASRLPQPLSAPGPIRNSVSPRRNTDGRSSPHGSASRRPVYGHPISTGVALSGSRAYARRRLPQHTRSSAHTLHTIPGDVPGLVAVKHSAKLKQLDDRRTSIPRPSYRFHHQDEVESEGDVFVANSPEDTASTNHLTSKKVRGSEFGSDDGYEAEVEHFRRKLPQSRTEGHVSKSDHILTNDKETADVFDAQSDASASTRSSFDGENPASTTAYGDHTRSSSTEKSTSNTNPFLNSARQRELIDKPSHRVKRLSAISPEHGPVLRISDSAERIIMGYGSEEDPKDGDTQARKRNSVPDLRRSVVIKELRKSTEGLLNGRLSLSRSLTSRSLTRHEHDEGSDERLSLIEPSYLHNEAGGSTSSRSVCEPEELSPPKHGSTADGGGPQDETISDRAQKPVRSMSTEWPLKSAEHTTTIPEKDNQHVSEDEVSWISPMQLPAPATVIADDSPAPVTNSETEVVDTHSGRHPMNFDRADSSSSNDHRLTTTYPKSAPTGLRRVPGSINANSHFPPRTSSRANTPNLSTRSRAQINLSSVPEIPNRFQSARESHLSDEFRLRKSTTVDSATLRNSIHNLKDGDAPKFSTPTAREVTKPQLSSAKGMLSNFKGLFHKKSMETPTASSPAKSKGSAPLNRTGRPDVDGSPFATYHSRTVPAKARIVSHKPPHVGPRLVATPQEAFRDVPPGKPLQSPGLDSDDFRQATDLTMRVLDAARAEDDGARRGRLLQLGQLMVEAVTGARDAEKAMEEAKQAAARAEVHCMRAKKSVLEITERVGVDVDSGRF